MTESEGARRLGEAIRDRRDRLGLTADQLAERLGVAAGTVYANEHGRAPARRHRSAYERELLWRPGSCDKILAGGEPDALPEPTPAALVVSPRERVLFDELHRLDEDTQARMLRVMTAAIRAELDDTL